MANTDNKNTDYSSALKQQKAKKKVNGNAIIASVVILIVIILAAYYFIFLNVNEIVVNSPTTVNVTTAGRLYEINSNQYYISLSTIAVSNGKAYVHVSKLPIFVNPLLNVTLTLGNITKLNLGTNYSNVGIQLQSLSANSITVTITSISTNLQIAPSSSDIKIISASLQGGYSSQSNATTVTTTISGASTTGSSSTVGSTTTVPATNQTALAISTALKDDSYYGLMLNYSALYTNSSNCTPLKYNNTYVEEFGHLPNGQDDYQNVSEFAPYNLSSSTTNVGKGDYNVTYVAKTTALGNIPAITIELNISTQSTVVDTVAASGVFGGDTYATMKSDYLTALGQGACGIIVP